MISTTRTALFAFAIAALPVAAQAKGIGIELAFMPNTMDVTLLNEGGKLVTVDMKRIAKGEKCRMEKDAIIMKVGPGATTGTILVRYAAPQLSHGGCPFMTEFELPDADYTVGRGFHGKDQRGGKASQRFKKAAWR
jgi:hypothetical protein